MPSRAAPSLPSCGHPAGDVDHVGDQRHRADADREAEDRDPDRQAHRDHASPRREQDDDRREHADASRPPRLRFLEGEAQLAAGLDPQHASLFGPPAPKAFRRAQAARGDIREHRIADTRCARPACFPDTTGRPRAEHVRQRRPTPPRGPARALPAPRASRSAPRVPGVKTNCAVNPAWSDPAARSSNSVARWESTPGTSKESSSSRPTRAGGADHEPRTPRARRRSRVHGRRAENRPSRYSILSGLLQGDRSPLRLGTPPSAPHRTVPARLRLLPFLRVRISSARPIPLRVRVLSTRRRWSTTLSWMLWAEPRAPAAPRARLARLGAGGVAGAGRGARDRAGRRSVWPPASRSCWPWRTALALLWRRTHPLAAVAFAFGTADRGRCRGVPRPGRSGRASTSSACVAVLPHALFRRGLGPRDRARCAVHRARLRHRRTAGEWTGIGDAIAALLSSSNFPAAPGASRSAIWKVSRLL